MKWQTGMGILLSCIIFGGCQSIPSWPESSGFLESYTGMHYSDELKDFLIFTHRDKKVADYSKFLVDPVVAYLNPGARAYHADPAELKKITDTLYVQIVSALQKHGAVVGAPGEGVLRVKVAITDIYNLESDAAKRGLLEAEFVDTRTRECIFSMMAAKRGIAFSEFGELLGEKLKEVKSETRIE